MDQFGRSSVVLVVVGIFFAVVVIGQCERSPESYLDKPSRTTHDAPAYDWLKRQLEERKFANHEEILEYFKQIRDTLPLPSGLSVKSFVINDILHELIKLADERSQCTYNMVAHYVKAVESCYGNLDAINRPQGPQNDTSGLYEYLKHYGKQKFAHSCLAQLKDDYQRIISSKLEADVEKAFDELIASQDKHIARTSSDRYLARLAARVDLAEGEFDGKKMLKVAKQYGNAEWTKLGASYTLRRFIARNCCKLLMSFRDLLNVFNMSRHLAPTSVLEAHMPDKLIKFNEYGYLCKQSQDSCQLVRANIDNKLAVSNFLQRAKNLVACH